MTALSADSPIKGPCIGNGSFPLAASAHPYIGSALGEASGYARPLVAGDKFLGHSIQNITNTAVAGANNVEAMVGRYALQVTLSGAAITDINRRVYMSDDATYTFAANGNSYVGRVKEYVTTDTVLVEFDTTGAGSGSELAYANIADATAVGASSTAEADFNKTATIPVEALKVGDVIEFDALIQHTGSNTGSTLIGKVYLATEVVGQCAAQTIGAQNDAIHIHGEITIRAIGASGSVESTYQTTSKLNATLAVVALASTGAVSEDISADVTLKVSAQYNAGNANNTAVLKHFTVKHHHAKAA